MMRVRWNLFLALGLLALTLTACAAGGNGGAEADEPARPNVSQEVSPEEGGENSAQADLAKEEEVSVELYLPNDNADGFVVVTETAASGAQGLVDALTAHGVLPEGVAVNSFETTSDGVETQEGDVVSYEVGEVFLAMDLSEEFLSALSGVGTAGETMVMGSLVNTFLTAYQAQTLTLTCGGAAVETGHAVYDEPLTFYDLPWAQAE